MTHEEVLQVLVGAIKKGSELYTFSHPEGSDDDKFWAIAMAVTAAMKREPEPHVGVILR